MRIGKMIVQEQGSWAIAEKFPEVINTDRWTCGVGCCSSTNYTLVGPKAKLQFRDYFSIYVIEREFSALTKTVVN